MAALAVLLPLLAGCTAAQPQARPERPALLTSATPQCHTAIEQALGRLLQAPVALSPGIFTTSPTLLLERPQPRDATGLPRDGRLLGKPVQVTLATDGRQCLLVGEHGRTTLSGCDCRAQATP